MADPGGVCRREPFADFERQIDFFLERQHTLLEALVERLPAQELHDDEEPPVVFADVVDGDDVAVSEAGRDLGFAHEPRANVRLGLEVGHHDLYRHVAIHHFVVRRVDDAHGAAADAFDDTVAPNALGSRRTRGVSATVVITPRTAQRAP